MTADRFVDTNVLAYVFDGDAPREQLIAQELLREGDFVLSAQVLGELYVTLTRKLRRPVPLETAAAYVTALCGQHVVPVTSGLVTGAITTSRRYQLSYWDSLVIEAAAAAGCKTLLTEDLTHGQVVRGVTITNPFRQ